MTELLPESILRLPGVVAVQSQLRVRPESSGDHYYERLIGPR